MEPTVYSHEADEIYEAWFEGREIRIPHPFADSFLPLSRAEVRSVETRRILTAGKDGLAVFPSNRLG